MVIYNLALAGLVGFNLITRIAKIDGVGGIKYTAPTHDEIMRIKEEIGRDFVVYSGADQMAMSGLMFGADGIIGSFYNMIPEVFMGLYDALKAGDLTTAQERQSQANAVIAFSQEYSYVSVIKRSMKWAGADGGYCRRPFAPISAAQEEELKTGLRKIRQRYNIEKVAIFDAL
jgi:N-acetylneuraminate lyase